MQLIGVKINDRGNIIYFKNKNLSLKKNLTVIVNTEKGLQFAKIYNIIEKEDENNDYNEIVRLTTKKDYTQYLSNLKDEKNAVIKARKLVEESDIDMHIIDAEYTFTRSQLIFRFIADERVDFRKLAKEMGTIFKTRIELRQIGVRDKAKEVGGVGPCGRCLCCNSFLKEFESVSINMAKKQSLSLNPSKINGVCGRLLCCLKYENDCCSKDKEIENGTQE